MANSSQSIKRARQAQKRRLHNQTARTLFRTMVKRAHAAVGGDGAKDAFIQMQSVIDRAAQKNLFHHKTVARIKRRINKAIRASAQTAPTAAKADAAN